MPSPAATDLIVVQFLRAGKPSASSTFALSVLINAVMMVARKHAIRWPAAPACCSASAIHGIATKNSQTIRLRCIHAITCKWMWHVA